MNPSLRDTERLLKENRNLRDSVRGYQQIVEHIRSLHVPAGRGEYPGAICAECLRDHPCPTLRTLDP